MTGSITAAISAEIVAARQAQGATREDVAAAARAAGAPASFTSAALRNLETGRRAVAVDELLWLAEALEVPVRQLLSEHRHLFGHDAPVQPDCGPVQAAARKAVEELGELSGRQEALAELAYALAAEIDGDGDKRQPAQVARALSDALDTIWTLQPADDDEDDDLGPE